MKILATFFQRKGITYTQYRTLSLLQLVLLKSGMSCHPSSIFHEWNTTLLKGLDRTRLPHPNIRGGRLDMNFSAKEDVKMTGRISKAPIYFESTGLISWGKSVEWSSLGRMSVQMSKVKLNFITYTSLMSSFAQVQQWRSALVAFDNHGNNGGLCNSLTNAAINASRWCFSNNHVFPFSHYFSPPVLEKKPPLYPTGERSHIPSQACSHSTHWRMASVYLAETTGTGQAETSMVQAMEVATMADMLAQGHWHHALWWFQSRVPRLLDSEMFKESVEMAGCAAINACEKGNEWRYSLQVLAVSESLLWIWNVFCFRDVWGYQVIIWCMNIYIYIRNILQVLLRCLLLAPAFIVICPEKWCVWNSLGMEVFSGSTRWSIQHEKWSNTKPIFNDKPLPVCWCC